MGEGGREEGGGLKLGFYCGDLSTLNCLWQGYLTVLIDFLANLYMK